MQFGMLERLFCNKLHHGCTVPLLNENELKLCNAGQRLISCAGEVPVDYKRALGNLQEKGLMVDYEHL